ncbi:MAG: hypothetical protein PF636_09855, partial [Actinomycetota bacterium]|nr:hypothetical protein [Actinomycetota bacterium]
MAEWLTSLPGNVAVPVAALVMGLVALMPVRSRLGAWGYALCSFPVGLVGWGFVPIVTTASDSVTRLRVILPVLVLYVTALMLAGLWAARRISADEPGASAPRVRWWVALLTLGVGVIAIRVLYEGGWSTYSGDSWSNYQMFGQILADTGRLNVGIITNRGLILPALHGASTFIGGGWTFTIYPLMSLNLLALLAYAIAGTAFDEQKLRYRALGTCVMLVALVSTAAFIFHSFYVHSHMVSALGMLLALVGIQRALSMSAHDRSTEEGGREPWLIVAGLGALLFSWARPDGIAYMFVLFLVFAFSALRRADEGGVRWGVIVAFFGPILMGNAAFFGVM